MPIFKNRLGQTLTQSIFENGEAPLAGPPPPLYFEHPIFLVFLTFQMILSKKKIGLRNFFFFFSSLQRFGQLAEVSLR